MPTDPCGNVLPNIQQVQFNQQIILPIVCADVDGVSQLVIPIVTKLGSNEAIEYRDALGNLITGVVTLADPCDCEVDCGDPPIPPTEVNVIIEIGQSNAAARRGDNFASGEIPSYSNVKIYNSNVSNDTIEDMVIGASGNSGESYTNNGDEGNYSIGTIYAASLDNCYVLKLAYGGTRLAQDTGSDWHPDSTDEYFDELQEDWTDFVAELTSLNLKPVVSKVIWVQGEADATTQSYADAYEDNLGDLIDAVNAMVGVTPDWHIARLRTDINAGSYPYRATVRSAQEAVIAARSYCYLLDVDASTGVTLPDGVHYDDDGIIERGLYGIVVELAPGDVSGQVLWFDGDDISEAVSATVETWTDKVSGTYELDQSVVASRPIVATQNSVKCLDFDGTDDYMEGGSVSALSDSNDWTVLIVGGADSAATVGTLMAIGVSTGYMLARCDTRTNKRFGQVFNGSTSFYADHISQLSVGFDVFTLQHESSTKTLSVYLNGVFQDSVVYTGNTNNDGITIGNRLSGTSVRLNGKICEILAYDSIISQSDHLGLVLGLQAKWGL